MSSFGKALVNIGEKLQPLFGPLFTFIGTLVSLGAKGVSFLAKNLWILALGFVYFLFSEAKEKLGKK